MNFKYLLTTIFLSFLAFCPHSVMGQSVTKGTLDIESEYPSALQFQGANIAGNGARIAFYLDEKISPNYLKLDSVRSWLANGRFAPVNGGIKFGSDIQIIPNYPIANGVTKDIVVVGASLQLFMGTKKLDSRWNLQGNASAFYALFAGHAPSSIEAGTFIAFKLKEASVPQIDYASSSLVLTIKGPPTGTYTLTNTQGYPVYKDRPELGNVATGRFEGGVLSLSNVVAGIYNLQVRADGYQSTSKNGIIVDANVSVNSEEISVLAEEIRTTLVVKDTDGNPIDRFTAVLSDLVSNAPAKTYLGRTSVQEFSFPLGKYELDVSAVGYDIFLQELTLTKSDIQAGKRIEVVLRKVGANARVQNVNVELTVVESAKSKELSKYFLRIKDADGNLVDSYPPSKTKRAPKIKLSPGTYKFEIELKGFYASPQPVVIDGNRENQSVTISMNKGNGQVTSRRTGGKFWAFLVLAGAGGAYYLTQTTNGGDGYGTPPGLPTP